MGDINEMPDGKMLRRDLITAMLVAGTVTCCTHAGARTPVPPTQIRGAIVSIEADTVKIHSVDDRVFDVTFSDSITIVSVRKLALTRVKVTDFVSISWRIGSDGKKTATEIHYVPEALVSQYGLFIWFYGSMEPTDSINATVIAWDGREMTVVDKAKVVTIVVPPDTPVVTHAPAARSDVKPGVQFIATAWYSGDGTLQIADITIEKDSLAPRR